MQKNLLVIVLLLIAVSVTGLFLFSTNEFSNNHGHMGQNAQTVRTLELLLFAVPLAISVAIAIYAVAFPEIKKSTTTQPAQPQVENKQTLEAILKVLNEDERKVVQALVDSDRGSLLQKEIGWKTKLSRVKTHRVVARLANRDIVMVEKQDNTNRVTLAEWVSKNKE
ncbi:MAG: hypothetical protein NWF01_01135 [Candidatus Bathyarchaeota archaeon]|nr:hypothetical protein [Candidatus Bathyarchaeota archaeon]